MFNPYISYTFSGKSNAGKKKGNIFQSLDSINNYMDLQYLDIVNGAIDLKIKDSLRMRFTGASVSIQSHAMLNSTKMEEIKKSLTSMSFDHGMIQSGALNVELKNFRYTRQSGRLSAGSIQVADKENRMNLSLEDADIKKLQVFEQTGHLVANGIKWQER